ncbi:MAG: hypothetical protein H6831_06770 [Planctomycetes bacterium]|nr:hypothetical protein [Planctomycetota bacterium]MCB9904093.1 hypothetical protein [Planctomycetota bacterium]
MQRPLFALLLASAALGFAPAASAQRALGSPVPEARPVTVTQFHHRHDRDFDRYRRTSRVQAPQRVWVPGHYEMRQREVVIPGCTERRWVPARFETRYDSCGRRFTVQISTGHWELVRQPDRIEIRTERVWVAAHWRTC